jgi:type II secretory pathway component PulJ
MLNIIYKKHFFQKGFSTIEVVISLSIASVIIGSMGMFARDVFFYKSVFSNQLSSYDDARHVLSPMSSEIRSASPSSLGSYPVEIADNSTFVFFTDLNSDGLKERVRYFLSGTTLKKGVISPTGNPLSYVTANEKFTELIHNVANGGQPIFYYFDTNYTGTSNPLSLPVVLSNVRFVKVNLIIDSDPNRLPEPLIVTTQISIRNLKDNL